MCDSKENIGLRRFYEKSHIDYAGYQVVLLHDVVYKNVEDKNRKTKILRHIFTSI